ncbi:betaine-aldehyde dehydrogenase [Pedobacter hartonius]|uniref:aldehyde dehydrogenase (NAD(+)) n=1 Tax=Pedobacter hartonius TaxID=425514 RepID=A0A1H3WSG8_9SPHI|nr:betaine-aldehyde dehydrogenase [Pedobacter hartonius]
MKRLSLELGGKSAAIILEDADLADTVEKLKFLSFANNGQMCVGQTRILAPESRYEEISNALAEMVAAIRVGDRADPETFQGPIFNKTQYESVNSYLELGLQEGAAIATGGLGKPLGAEFENGWYVKPTVDYPYGLSGSVWTADKEKGLEIARQIRTGVFSINGAQAGFDTPFGGYKQSGVGREYGSAGLEVFTETKSIAM